MSVGTQVREIAPVVSHSLVQSSATGAPTFCCYCRARVHMCAHVHASCDQSARTVITVMTLTLWDTAQRTGRCLPSELPSSHLVCLSTLSPASTGGVCLYNGATTGLGPSSLAPPSLSTYSSSCLPGNDCWVTNLVTMAGDVPWQCGTLLPPSTLWGGDWRNPSLRTFAKSPCFVSGIYCHFRTLALKFKY